MVPFPPLIVPLQAGYGPFHPTGQINQAGQISHNVHGQNDNVNADLEADDNANVNDDDLNFAQHLAQAMIQSQKHYEDYENAKKKEEYELQRVIKMSLKKK